MLAVDQSGKTAWAHADQLGSIVLWSSYDTSWHFEHKSFDAFGNLDNQTGVTLPTGELPQIWAGHQFESDLNLYHAQARWYDPRSGQFISLDPTRFDAGDANLYRYAGNDAVNAIDPTGLEETPSAYGQYILNGRFQIDQGTVQQAHTAVALADRLNAVQGQLDEFRFEQFSYPHRYENLPTFARIRANTMAALTQEEQAIRAYFEKNDVRLSQMSVSDEGTLFGYDKLKPGIDTLALVLRGVEPVLGAKGSARAVAGPEMIPAVILTGGYIGGIRGALGELGQELFMGATGLPYYNPKGLFQNGTPNLYWHGSNEGVDAAIRNGLFDHGAGRGEKLWATSRGKQGMFTEILIGGNRNVDSLIPFRTSTKGGFEAVYKLTTEEASKFSRAWGFR